MNILFCLDSTFNPIHGGIANVSLFLGEYFVKIGNKVFFISYKQNASTIVENQYYLPDKNCADSATNKRWFTDFINTKSIDVVINQMGATPYSQWPIKWTYNTSAKLITVIHTTLDGIYGCNCNYFINKIYLKTFLDKIFHYYFKLKYGRYYKNQIEKSEAVVVLSKKFIPELYWYSTKKGKNVFVIENPLTLNDKNNENIEKVNEIVFVGRLSKEKQPELLLKIWAEIYKDCQTWSLIFVGDGKQKSQLESLAKKMGIAHVRFVGYQNPLCYYKRAKIFCMTSAFEGFGLVLIEAMSQGCVPIAFNSYKNAGEIIDTNENGFLIPPFDENEYKKILLFLINNEHVRQTMSESAKKKSETFSISKIGMKWQHLFNQISNK